MVALRGTAIELSRLDEALAEPKLLDPELYETAEVFFGLTTTGAPEGAPAMSVPTGVSARTSEQSWRVPAGSWPS